MHAGSTQLPIYKKAMLSEFGRCLKKNRVKRKKNEHPWRWWEKNMIIIAAGWLAGATYYRSTGSWLAGSTFSAPEEAFFSVVPCFLGCQGERVIINQAGKVL